MGTINFLNDTSRPVRDAVRKIEFAGFDVPESLRTAVARVNAIRTVGDAPTPPSITDAGFDKKFATYLREHSEFQAAGVARQEAFSAATRELQRVALSSADELLPALREEFRAAADDYAAAARQLVGVVTIADAAGADLDGSTVRAWHDRSQAAKRLGALVDVVKAILFPLISNTGDSGFKTEMVICMIADTRNAYVYGRDIREQAGEFPPEIRRYQVLHDAGVPLSLISSVDELRARVSRMSMVD